MTVYDDDAVVVYVTREDGGAITGTFRQHQTDAQTGADITDPVPLFADDPAVLAFLAAQAS